MSVKEKEIIRLLSTSKQVINIHVRPPKSDFYIGEQPIALMPGKVVDIPRTYVNYDQVKNLQAKGFIKILADSDPQ